MLNLQLRYLKYYLNILLSITGAVGSCGGTVTQVIEKLKFWAEPKELNFQNCQLIERS